MSYYERRLSPYEPSQLAKNCYGKIDIARVLCKDDCLLRLQTRLKELRKIQNPILVSNNLYKLEKILDQLIENLAEKEDLPQQNRFILQGMRELSECWDSAMNFRHVRNKNYELVQLQAEESVKQFQTNYQLFLSARSSSQSLYYLHFLKNMVGKRNALETFYEHINQPDAFFFQKVWNTPLEGIPRFLGQLSAVQVQYCQTVDISTEIGIVQALILIPEKIECKALDALKKYKKVMLHAHGGGFISLSPDNSKPGLTQMLKYLNLPIVSVYYSKAPQHKYPQAVNQCFAVYRQLRQSLPASQLLLMGDSAGGNLMCGVGVRCYNLGLRPPQQICLVYPCMSLELKRRNPYLMHSLTDKMLPPSILKSLREAYLKAPDLEDALQEVSPLRFVERTKVWPSTLMFVSGIDALTGDALSSSAWMPECKVIQFKGLPHGFLGMGFKGGIKECAEGVRRVLQELGSFVNN